MNHQNLFMQIGTMLVIAIGLFSTACVESKAKEETKAKAPQACEVVLAVSGMS